MSVTNGKAHIVEQKQLPLSGMQLQWRSTDRHYRVRHPTTGPVTTEASADELLWRPWTGRGDMAVGVSGEQDQDDSLPRWWVVWGESNGDAVSIVLDDGSRPDISQLGGLWVSEWAGPKQTAIVTTARLHTEVRFAPPSFVGPPLPAGRPPRRWAYVETPTAFRVKKPVVRRPGQVRG